MVKGDSVLGEGGWRRVSYHIGGRRASRRWDTFPWGCGNRIRREWKDVEVTSFYVSEFPESHSAKDLY